MAYLSLEQWLLDHVHGHPTATRTATPTTTLTAGHSGRSHPYLWMEWPTSSRSGRPTCRPLEPTVEWNGRPPANGSRGRADVQTCPNNVFWMWFSQLTSKVTTLLVNIKIIILGRWKRLDALN
jgi:hypothetical protein